MHKTVLLAALLALVACKKKENDAPAPSAKETGSAAAAPATPTPAPAPAPTPPPAPVALTAEELKPTCAKIVTAELAAKTHGATEVKQEGGEGGRLAVCTLLKDGESVGSITVACKPDLDPTAIQRERAAMTKATDIPPSIGRGGYRISSIFFFNDDETPCRLQVAFMTVPADDVLPDALRAITAAVNPGTLK